ncbi:MAG: hypothetical protein KKB20_19960 [Proteobacteria bacterium]|nr:hypothetical protein [Pseudomonadota bacterium]
MDENMEKMLAAIFRETGGDPNRSAGMWAIGEAMGLDRPLTQDIAMELVAEGLVEIRNLSGGLSLTEAGLGQAGTGAEPQGAEAPDLGALTARFEAAVNDLGLDAAALKDVKADLETLKAQGRRSKPLPEVVAVVLAALAAALSSAAGSEAGALLELISKYRA